MQENILGHKDQPGVALDRWVTCRGRERCILGNLGRFKRYAGWIGPRRQQADKIGDPRDFSRVKAFLLTLSLTQPMTLSTTHCY